MASTSEVHDFEKEKDEERVRKCLNRDKIKLWEPPYTTADGQKGEEPNELVDRYTAELEMSPSRVRQTMEGLRSHAVGKLAARTKFTTTGVATLKAKLTGCVPEKAQIYSKNRNLSIETGLNISGNDLKQMVSEKSGVEIVRLKAICNGRVVEDGVSLQEQGIKNQANIMVLCLSDGEVEARKQQDLAASVSKTKDAAMYLSNKDDDTDEGSDYFLQVADQTGKKLQIPAAERKALVLAMTLHEKARAAMRRKSYSEALLLLLEADTEFKHCNSELLTGVDNYALVCLDISWCYLCLESLSNLPDAEVRLKTCDDCLRKSYGPNLERLAVVKGETGIERALFMRLHLLQAIVAFHKGNSNESSNLLDRVEREIRELQVDESAMAEVMGLGFTDVEARLSLRASNGSVSLAVSHIMKKQEEKKERLKKEKEERRCKRLAKKFGKTSKGESVNIQNYETLLSMGFAKGASVEALRQTNNDIPAALQVLQDHPELLDLPDPEGNKVNVSDALISQVTMMGFSVESARLALNKFYGNASRAVEELLKVGGIAPPTWREEKPGTSSSSSPESPEKKEKEKFAMENIVPDIAEDEEAHLDFTLEEEIDFMNRYRGFINSVRK